MKLREALDAPVRTRAKLRLGSLAEMLAFEVSGPELVLIAELLKVPRASRVHDERLTPEQTGAATVALTRYRDGSIEKIWSTERPATAARSLGALAKVCHRLNFEHLLRAILVDDDSLRLALSTGAVRALHRRSREMPRG